MEKITLETFCGDTFQLTLSVKDSNGDPIDLGDATVRFKIDAGTENSVTEETDTVIVESDDEGVISIVVPYAAMTMPASTYPFDVEVTYGEDSIRRTLVWGDLTVHQDVSREVESA